MGVFDWAKRAMDNAVLSLGGFQLSDLLPTRNYGAVTRDLIAQVRCYADDQGGALRTGGVGNSYVVNTFSGIRVPRPGVSILVEVDRANTDAVTLDIDGTGPRPWLDLSGAQMPSGALQPSALLRATWSDPRNAWVSNALGGLTVGSLDLVMRLWWASLPEETRGIGPNQPYRNNGSIAFTTTDNPAFTIDSPEGLRQILMRTREALPKTDTGLGPGEPWINNGVITFVPDDYIPNT